MGLLDRITEAMPGRRREHAWPVGRGALQTLTTGPYGYDDSEYSPEEYGDYVAASNEVYVAASLRARLMSGLRLRLYRGHDSDKKAVETGPAVRLLRRPNPYWSMRRLLRMDELAMCLWGETYWAVERGPDGQPSEIWWVKPSRMRPVPDENRYLKGFLYEPTAGAEPIAFTPDEVIWYAYPNPLDEFSPLSPLAAARLAADTSTAMMRSNHNLFRQGLQMGGLVVPADDKVTFSREQAEDLERQLERRFKGVDKAHKWAVLRYEAQFKNLGVSPKDAEFTEGLGLTARQVWNAYGIPAPLVNDLAHATLANTREYERLMWTNTLVPDAELKADEIQERLLPMFTGRGRPDHAAFDFTQVAALQESATEAWTREAQAIDRGTITINEWRAGKGMPPVAWGDVYWAPVNKSAVTDATSTPQGDTAPAGPPADEDPPPGDGDPDEGDGQADGDPADGEDLAADLRALLDAFGPPARNGHHPGAPA